MPVKVAPSLLSADFGHLARVVKDVEEAGADYIHFDIMDGHFVPNITIGPLIVAAARSSSRLFFDVHLMIESPERYVEDFAQAGANGLTIQAETVNHLFRAIDSIHRAGMRAGVAISPGTPVERVVEIAHAADLILVMTVDPGYGGQPFIPSMIDKVRRTAEILRRMNSQAEIEVDGGIDPTSAPQVIDAGATVLVAGSAVFRSGLPLREAIARLRWPPDGIPPEGEHPL